MTNLTPEPWLNLGIAGAAMFIVLVVVLLTFNQLTKNMVQLCEKIERLVDSFSANTRELTRSIERNDSDQKQLIGYMTSVQTTLNEVNRRVTRIDTRLYDKSKDDDNAEDGE